MMMMMMMMMKVRAWMWELVLRVYNQISKESRLDCRRIKLFVQRIWM